MTQQVQNFLSLKIQPPEQLYYVTLTFLFPLVDFDVQDKGNSFQKVLVLYLIIFNSWGPR